MSYQRWIRGYLVDWMEDWTFEKDGKTYCYANIQYIRPGGRINNPVWEKSYLLYPAETAREMMQVYPETLVERLACLDAPRLAHITLNPHALDLYKSLRRL